MVDRRFSNTYSRHANYSYIEEQNTERTEQLCSKVKQLKYIVVGIQEETKRQHAELTKFQELMNLTNSLVGQARRRVILLSRSNSWKIYLYLMLFSLFVFLTIYFFIK